MTNLVEIISRTDEYGNFLTRMVMKGNSKNFRRLGNL